MPRRHRAPGPGHSARTVQAAAWHGALHPSWRHRCGARRRDPALGTAGGRLPLCQLGERAHSVSLPAHEPAQDGRRQSLERSPRARGGDYRRGLNFSMKEAGTSYHVHFDVQVPTKYGWVFVNPYMTLVTAYERLIDERGTEFADPSVIASADPASTAMTGTPRLEPAPPRRTKHVKAGRSNSKAAGKRSRQRVAHQDEAAAAHSAR